MAASSVPALRALVTAQHRQRETNPGRVGIKVNLYHGYELEAVAAAAAEAALDPDPIECFMVADSYLMTHLGRPSTRLAPGERDWGLALMAALVAECRDARDGAYRNGARPYILGDLPDGAARTPRYAVTSAQVLIDAGAEAVKLEVAGRAQLAQVDALGAAGIPVVVHLGYSPQRGELRRHGQTRAEVAALCDLAGSVRNLGAVAVVVEMVTEAVNQLLCAPDPDALPVYSIFSGRADLGGQSVNVWDSVFRRTPPSRFFPPTATLDPTLDRDRYRPPVIRAAMRELLQLTVEGRFPPSPRPATGDAALEGLAAWSTPTGEGAAQPEPEEAAA